MPSSGRVLAGILSALSILSGSLSAYSEEIDGPVAFVGATLIDGTGAPPVEDAVVVVQGDRIVAAGPRGGIGVPQDARRIDLSGCWIMPGLIDAHVHVFQSGGLYTRPDVIDLRDVRPYETELRVIRERLPETLARYLARA